MDERSRSRKRKILVLQPSELLNSAYNRTRKVWFGTLVAGGWFSAAPDDLAVNRAVRTNNAGALNISAWQRKRAGYVGQTKPDAAGNITTIYQTPEHGVSAWFFLLSDVYDFGTMGYFDLLALAKKYAGSNASPSEIRAYTDGWSKWSKGTLQPDTVVHLNSDDEMLDLAKAEFAHEAAATSPLHDDQILHGLSIERKSHIC